MFTNAVSAELVTVLVGRIFSARRIRRRWIRLLLISLGSGRIGMFEDGVGGMEARGLLT